MSLVIVYMNLCIQYLMTKAVVAPTEESSSKLILMKPLERILHLTSQVALDNVIYLVGNE